MPELRRREFITLLGGAAAMWPLAARAQQATLPVVGFLGSASAGSDAYLIAAFRQGLSEAGYVEARNVAIEYRWAEGQYDRLPAMVSELLRRHVAAVIAECNHDYPNRQRPSPRSSIGGQSRVRPSRLRRATDASLAHAHPPSGPRSWPVSAS